MRASTLLFTIALSSLCLTSPVSAQFELVGTVRANGTLQPIPDVRLELIDSWNSVVASTVTNELGAFAFRVRRDSGYRVRATHIAFRTTLTPRLFLDDYRFTQIEIRLDTEVALLAPIEVIGRAGLHRSPRLDNVRTRMRSGLGTYVTRADLEGKQIGTMSDLLRRQPGVTIESSGSGRRGIVYFRRGCPAEIFLDGMRVTTPAAWEAGDVSVDDYAHPNDIEVVEIYRGLATTPAEFTTLNGRGCGVVSIWTRRGGA